MLNVPVLIRKMSCSCQQLWRPCRFNTSLTWRPQQAIWMAKWVPQTLLVGRAWAVLWAELTPVLLSAKKYLSGAHSNIMHNEYNYAAWDAVMILRLFWSRHGFVETAMLLNSDFHFILNIIDMTLVTMIKYYCDKALILAKWSTLDHMFIVDPCIRTCFIFSVLVLPYQEFI